MSREVLSRVYCENKHVRVAWLRPDPAALQNLLRHFEKLPPSPVLIDEKLRLDVKAQGVGRMLFD
jgi:hypothetical protein